jgi:hypothetical protein
MDDLKLESELTQLTPAQPTSRLWDRLDRELSTEADARPSHRAARTAAAPAAPRRAYQTATSWTSWKWANWTVAAALVVMFTVAGRWAPTTPTIGSAATVAATEAVPVLHPVRAARTLVDTRQEALLELPDGSPVQRVRDYYVDTIEWQDDAGEAHLRWELPSEADRYVGLSSY